jgi:hypothetical protein
MRGRTRHCLDARKKSGFDEEVYGLFTAEGDADHVLDKIADRGNRRLRGTGLLGCAERW